MIGVEDDNEDIPTPSNPIDIDIPEGVLLISIESDTPLTTIKFDLKLL